MAPQPATKGVEPSNRFPRSVADEGKHIGCTLTIDANNIAFKYLL